MKLSNLSNQSQFYRQALGRKLAPASKPIYFTGSANKLIKAAANEGENAIDKIGHKNQIRERISAFLEKHFHKKPLVLKKPIVTALDPSQAIVATINGQAVPVQQAIQQAAQFGVQIAIHPATQNAVQQTGVRFAGHPAVQNAAQQAGAAVVAIAAALIGW